MKPKDILWFLWFVILTLSPLVLASQLIQEHLSIFAVLFSPAWGSMLFKMLYDRWDWFYFFANRFWLRITASELSWDFSVEFGVDDSDTSLEKVRKLLLGRFPNAQLKIKTPIDTAIKFRGYSLFLSSRKDLGVQAIGEEIQQCLVVEITDFAAPFGTSERLLDREIFPLLESVKDAISPSHQKYVMKLNFERGNPYFGLFVRKLHLRQVISFNCQFVETIGEQKETVNVSKEKLTLVTESIASLTVLTHKYLTLSAAV